MFSPINPQKLRHGRAAGINQSIPFLQDINSTLDELQGTVDKLLPGLASLSIETSGQQLSPGHVSITVETYIFMARDHMLSARTNLEFARQEASTFRARDTVVQAQRIAPSTVGEEAHKKTWAMTVEGSVLAPDQVRRRSELDDGTLLHDSSSPPLSSGASITEEETASRPSPVLPSRDHERTALATDTTDPPLSPAS